MAQRRRRNEQTNGVKNGSWGVSQKALDALESGTYGQMTGRKAKYRTSQEQTQQVNDLPALEGLFTEAKPQTWERKFGKSNVDTDRARRNYAANHTPIGKGLTQKDADLIANGALNMLNNNISADEAANKMRMEGITSNYARSKDWEKEYGKTLETLIEEYANSNEAMSRHFSEVGRRGNGLSKTVGSMGMNAFIKPAMAARTIPSNIISPDSEKTNKLNKASELMSDVAQTAKDSTTRNAGTIGKGLYDFGTNIGERISRDVTPFGWILNGLATAEDVRQELSKEGVSNRKSAGYGLARGTLDAIASKFAGKLGQNSKGANFATRALKSGAKQGTLGGIEQTIAELTDAAILGDEGTFNRDVQNYMARGLSEEEARDRAWENTLLRIGGMAATRGAIGAVSSLGSDAMKGVQNKIKDLAYRAYINRYVVDPDDPIFNEPIVDIDDLNEYFAPQNALEGQAFPQLTGTVDNTQALSGSQYNVPALVDNIYPIQMPGTNGVIPMPGTNGVITPVVGGGSAPISNIADDIDWRVGSPRYVKKLEGADLEAATKQIADNNAAIGRIKNEIEIIKGDKGNYYRGKLKKAVQTDIANREKEIKKIEGNTKELTHQVNGGLKPMLDMLTTEQKNNIYSVNGKHDSVFSDINFTAKFAGDTPEAKKLAKTAQNAISRYVRTGDVNEVKTMTDALMELDQMAKATNAMWTSSRGNEWTYGQRFGEQAKPLYNLKPVTDIYNAERALEKAAGRTAKSAPIPEEDINAAVAESMGTSAPDNDYSYTVPNQYRRENGAIKVGRATKVRAEYTGDTSKLPVQSKQNTDRYSIPDETFNRALQKFDDAINGETEGKSAKSILTRVYKDIFAERKKEAGTEHINVPIKNIKDSKGNDYTVSITSDAVGKAFNSQFIPEKVAVLDDLPNIINKSTYVGSADPVAKKGIERYDYFEKLAHINGKDYVVTFAVEIQPNINKYRTHALIDEIKIQQTSGNIGTGNDPSMPSPNVAEFSNEIVPQIPQNVNATQPNFTTVGQPYTPQEVPNVQPTPPTPEPPQPEVPNMDGGKEKTSQYYKNTMRGTETNRNMSDEEYANRFNEELYKRMTIPEQQSVNMGRNFIKESGGRDAAIERLLSGDFDSEERFSGFHIDAAEMLANDLERQALELEKMGQDASDLWRKANRLHKKIQLNASDFGVGMQALQKWKKSTPQGAYDDLVSQINKGIDKKKTTGYTRNVNDLADKIEDAIANSNSKEDLLSKIREIFGKNRENSDYNTKKAEQQVLDLVGGSKNNKKSITDLAEEASRIIKKEMGVSTLTPREERAVLNLLDAASQVEPGTRAYNELVSQAMVIVDESLPSSMGEKFKSLLYDNMLASIKTMFTRNFGGNVVGNAIDAMAAPFQVGADAIVGKFTGARTRSLTGKSIIAAAKGLGHGFKDWGQDIGYSLKNKTAFNTARSGQESLADVLQAVHKTWKTQSQNKAVKAVHNALSAYDYVIRKGMEGGDRPIYEAQYAATKAELYDVVDKYGDAGIRKGLPADKRDLDTDDLIEAMAINEGLEAVLQNDSKMKEAAKNLKAFFKKSSEDMLGIDIASMSHAPFVEVPANMASNFFKLTPIGWAGNIARTIGEKKKYGSINQRRFTGELGLNVLGGLLIGGGVAAADKFISGPYSEDKDEKKLQQNNGYLEYALQTPDESTQVDISDIPYLGPMLKFAKTERDAYKENGLEGALSAVPSAASAATVDTLYQALNRLTGADFQYNGNGNLISNAVSNIKSSVGSMGVPSVVRQTAQFIDPYKRDLGDYGTDEYNKNLIINGIPGLRQTMLEPKIDTAGQPVPELGGATGIRRFLSAYVSPYKVSHPHENTSAVQEYANMLKLATEGAVNPQMKVINASDLKKIKGYDAENYSHADLRELQEDYYKSNTELGNALINDPWFTNLSYEKQGELLDQLWSANKALVSEEFVRKGLTPEQIEAKGDELYTTDNKLAGIIRDDDEKHTGLLKWLKDETSRDELNAKYGTEMSHDDYVKFNEREEGYPEQRASEAAKAKALGMSVDSYEKYEAEYEGGAQGRYDDVEAAKQYGFVDANKKANTDAYNIAKQLGNGDPTVIQAYSDYKKQGYNSNAYGAKADYLVDEDRFTPTQKGMIIVGSQDGTLKGKVASGARNAFDIGNSNGKNDGYAGIYYYYLLKNMADADNSGSVTKKEREAFIAGDNRYLDELWNLNQDMYNYLAANLK